MAQMQTAGPKERAKGGQPVAVAQVPALLAMKLELVVARLAEMAQTQAGGPKETQRRQVVRASHAQSGQMPAQPRVQLVAVLPAEMALMQMADPKVPAQPPMELKPVQGQVVVKVQAEIVQMQVVGAKVLVQFAMHRGPAKEL